MQGRYYQSVREVAKKGPSAAAPPVEGEEEAVRTCFVNTPVYPLIRFLIWVLVIPCGLLYEVFGSGPDWQDWTAYLYVAACLISIGLGIQLAVGRAVGLTVTPEGQIRLLYLLPFFNKEVNPDDITYLKLFTTPRLRPLPPCQTLELSLKNGIKYRIGYTSHRAKIMKAIIWFKELTGKEVEHFVA